MEEGSVYGERGEEEVHVTLLIAHRIIFPYLEDL
jgi:hypothetical protein